MIYYFTPFATDKRYGKAINEHCKNVPDDGWICVRDGDTMFLNDDYGHIIEEAIKDNPDCDLFSCRTNRAFGQGFDPETNILSHYQKSLGRPKKYTKIIGVIPAFFWLFSKQHWLKNKFDEHPIIHDRKSFDTRWCKNNQNWKILRIDHLYIFHFYRLHKHRKDHKHLI